MGCGTSSTASSVPIVTAAAVPPTNDTKSTPTSPNTGKRVSDSLMPPDNKQGKRVSFSGRDHIVSFDENDRIHREALIKQPSAVHLLNDEDNEEAYDRGESDLDQEEVVQQVREQEQEKGEIKIEKQEQTPVAAAAPETQKTETTTVTSIPTLSLPTVAAITSSPPSARRTSPRPSLIPTITHPPITYTPVTAEVIDPEQADDQLTIQQLFNMMNAEGPMGPKMAQPYYMAILDVRPKTSYNTSHLITSIHVAPAEEYDIAALLQTLEDTCTELPQTIVVYDEQGFENGALVSSTTQSLLNTLQQAIEDGSLPSIVYTLRSGFTLFTQHHPYLCTSSTSIDRTSLSIYPSAIIPHQLYLGTYYQAGNLDMLRALGISHVVNVAAGTRCKFKDNPITYLAAPPHIKDHKDVSIREFINESTKFIESALSSGHRVLVHCAHGISRSATVVIAYLMSHHKWTLKQAFDYVRTSREQIMPNKNFMSQLSTLEAELLGSATTDVDEIWDLKLDLDELYFPYELAPGVHLGNEKSAHNRTILADIGIGCILNCTTEIVCTFENDTNLRYVRLNLPPRHDTPCREFFKQVCQEIDTCVASNIPVLLHCVHDWSRSQTLVCAWLMHSRHWTLDEAYHHIASVKLDARFDAMFYDDLMHWEHQLFNDTKKSDLEKLKALDKPFDKRI